MNIENAHREATIAAQAAAESSVLQYGKESEGNWDACGFAWVKTDVDGRSAAARQLKKLGFTKDWNYGYTLWNPSGYGGQNMREKEAGARAYAHVMTENTGIEFFMQSRMD